MPMSFESLNMYDCYPMSGSIGGCPSNANIKTEEGFCVCSASDSDWIASGKTIQWEPISVTYWDETSETRDIE